MGYSHLWKIRNLEQWKDVWPKLVRDTRTILDAADIDLTSERIWDMSELEKEYNGSDDALKTLLYPPPPTVDEDEGIFFNGIHQDGCEPFMLDRVPEPEGYGDPYTYSCKTNRRPYSMVICAILTRAKQLLGNSFYAGVPSRVDAESEHDDWHYAFALVDLLWPNDEILEDFQSEDEDRDCEQEVRSQEIKAIGSEAPSPSSINFARGIQANKQESTPQDNVGNAEALLRRNRLLHFPEEAMAIIRRWISQCNAADSSHSDCWPIKSQHMSPLMRLIDVAKGCIVNASPGEPYAALSYVWGASRQQKLLTTNMKLLMEVNGIWKHGTGVSRTIYEALSLCRELGYRYLWVDALCILQDNPRDKALQLNKMREVYNHADITIVAANGNSADSGLGFPDADTIAHSSVESSSIWPEFLYSLSRTVWDTRAWTLQEKVLSRCLLVFSPDGPYLVCGMLIHSKSGYQRLDTAPASSERPGGYSNIAPGKQLESYLDTVQRYSRRQVTVDLDFANAMKGITKAFGHVMDNRPNGFHQGIPTCFFDELFCWRTVDHQPGARRAGFRSWSWQGWKQTPIFCKQVTDQIKWKEDIGGFGSCMLEYDRTRGFDETGLEAHGVNATSDLNPLMLRWSGGQLEVAMECSEDVGSTNGMFQVFSPINGQQAGMIQLDKEWRASQPRNFEFLPVLNVKTGGQVRVKMLLCLERSKEPSRIMSSPKTSFERVQIMDCDISKEDWEKMVVLPEWRELRWLF